MNSYKPKKIALNCDKVYSSKVAMFKLLGCLMAQA